MDESYALNLDECNSVRTGCITLYVNGNNATYFDIFGVEYIPKEIENFIGNNNNKYLQNTILCHASTECEIY